MLRIRLATSAYAPMLLMIAVRCVPGHPCIAAALAAIAVLLVVQVVLLVNARNGLAAEVHDVRSVDDETAQVPAYLVTYVLPIILLRDATTQDLVVLGMYFGLALWLAASSQLVLVNPVMLLIGLRLYVVELDAGRKALMLSRGRPRPGPVRAIEFAGGGLKQVLEVE